MAGALWCNFYGLWDALKSVTEKQPEKQIANLRTCIVVKAAESTKQAEIKANFQETLGGKKQLCCVRVSHQEEECILLWFFFFPKHGFEVDKGEWAHLPVEIKFHSYNWKLQDCPHHTKTIPIKKKTHKTFPQPLAPHPHFLVNRKNSCWQMGALSIYWVFKVLCFWYSLAWLHWKLTSHWLICSSKILT